MNPTIEQGEAELSADLRSLLGAIDDGLAVLDEEREIFLSGSYERLHENAAKKASVVEAIERSAFNVGRSPLAIVAVRRLITASRRNEEIIRSARQGLAQAMRTIRSLAETRRGVVAYSHDGSPIAYRAMGETTGKSA